MYEAFRCCEVTTRKSKTIQKGYFHCWSDVSEIVSPSIMQGGHGGGVVRQTFGIVELENGEIQRFYPEEIRFTEKPRVFVSADEVGA